MNLNIYVYRSLIAAPANVDVTPPGSVEIPRPLLDRFLELRDRSEDEGVEFGFNLYWDDGRVTVGEAVRGTQERTPLNTSVERLTDHYVGDFHTHPYHRRLHDHASIGPSISDLEEIVEKRPARKPIGVYFVIAGHVLHLVFLDRSTLRDGEVPGDDLAKVEPTFATLTSYKRAHGVEYDHRFNTLKPDPVPSHHPDFHRSLERERLANSQVPGYHVAFEQANLKMNRQYAALFHYHYYVGNLESTANARRLGTADGEVILDLQPYPIWARGRRDSSSTGLVCCKCLRVHSRWRSSVFGRWHRCRRCWSTYCAWCGDALQRPVYLTRERACDRPSCGGRTELID